MHTSEGSNKPCWGFEDDEEQSDPNKDVPDNNNNAIDVEDVLEAGDRDWRNEGLHDPC